MINIYGTIGPACANTEIFQEMFREGMTGMRLNTSHISVKEAAPQIRMIREAAAACGVEAQILIDMQGPELRIAKMIQQMKVAVASIPRTIIPKYSCLFHMLPSIILPIIPGSLPMVDRIISGLYFISEIPAA